ncbi:MAG: tRNA pseudouridine(38-40) synthase TruA [Desulfobacteraceae bacterium 4572_35.2]|nr:MAG: tRNA pseudouridine(38-40) synthase TruA [Desulfobacteraceae bacterium 4572_35.2]
MTRICLTIEYDGTRYGGWQIQPNADTIQECVEKALEKVIGSHVRVYSSGRTDAGVHSVGMRAHFDTGTLLPLSAYREGVNRFLAADVAIRSAEVVDEHFHARFDAVGKWYQYKVYRGKIRSPLQRNTAWHVPLKLDIESIVEAATFFVGRHDFSAFRSSSCVAKTATREIYAFDVIEQGDFLIFNVKGSGFLKNMVRVLVGTLVDVGSGQFDTKSIQNLLECGERKKAGRTAPACGLCLMDVWYEKNM